MIPWTHKKKTDHIIEDLEKLGFLSKKKKVMVQFLFGSHKLLNVTTTKNYDIDAVDHFFYKEELTHTNVYMTFCRIKDKKKKIVLGPFTKNFDLLLEEEFPQWHGQTDKQTHRLTWWMVERIGPGS